MTSIAEEFTHDLGEASSERAQARSTLTFCTCSGTRFNGIRYKVEGRIMWAHARNDKKSLGATCRHCKRPAVVSSRYRPAPLDATTKEAGEW